MRSDVADYFEASLGERRGTLRHRGPGPQAIVIHTTGRGPVDRMKDPKFRDWRIKHPTIATPLDAAIWIYTQAMKSGPHYVIGQNGRIVQVTRENRVAEHVGSAGAMVYRLPTRVWCGKDQAWWPARWPSLRSPRELAGGTLWEHGVNAVSIGIEVVPDEHRPTGAWSARAWNALAHLVTDVAHRYDIPIERDRIITHADAHPRARSHRGQPADPWPQQWSFEAMVTAIARVSV